MILTHAEAKALVKSNEVDPYRLVQAVEKAVLAKLADKLKDAERLDYHLKGNPMTVKMKKSILMLGPNKEQEYPLAFRCAIDAAMLARKSETP